jgi:hypothetical protein
MKNLPGAKILSLPSASQRRVKEAEVLIYQIKIKE